MTWKLLGYLWEGYVIIALIGMIIWEYKYKWYSKGDSDE